MTAGRQFANTSGDSLGQLGKSEILWYNCINGTVTPMQRLGL